ncbi:MAG: AraC family transcriptional regulator [Hungatella sp.]|nr:AraC family transcriptional regulator [Hungatella sp.]
MKALNARITSVIGAYRIPHLCVRFIFNDRNAHLFIKQIYEFVKRYDITFASNNISISFQCVAKSIISFLGYETSSYFTRIFKNKYGVTPSQYKKEHTKAI